ncbi:hypothetical protein NQZ68_000913 [Dissostichus eleginoides]|nr:hypothetical protein NQZ68_000913 [Dissostichus eleginoides]
MEVVVWRIKEGGIQQSIILSTLGQEKLSSFLFPPSLKRQRKFQRRSGSVGTTHREPEEKERKQSSWMEGKL